MIAAVATTRSRTRWLGTWLPDGWTTRWYTAAWKEFQLGDVLMVTVQVVFAVVLLSGLIGVPAAYALARREFPRQALVMLLFLLPLMVPPITYGIPLATVLYQAHLAGTIWGVILANLVPAVPFVILVMTPFIEQIDPKLESAARVFGANTLQLFFHVLVPLLAARHPRRAPAGAGAHHRDVRADLPHRRAGLSQTLVVALYYAVFAAGVRAVQSIDAMAMIYMVDDAGVAADRAALRQSDADRDTSEAGSALMSCGRFVSVCSRLTHHATDGRPAKVRTGNPRARFGRVMKNL